MHATESLADVMSAWFRGEQYGRILRLAHATLGANRLAADMWLWVALARARLGHVAAARHACLKSIDSKVPTSDKHQAEQLFTTLTPVPIQPGQVCVTDLLGLTLPEQRLWVTRLLEQVPDDPLRLPVLFVVGASLCRARLSSVPQCMPVERALDNDPLWLEDGVLFRTGLSAHHMITPEAALTLWTDRSVNRAISDRGNDLQVQL